MKRGLVLGIGNRIMGDDGIGVRVVEALASDHVSEDIDFIAGETDVDFCLSQLSAADYCFIIDGSMLGKKPCAVDHFPLHDIYQQTRSVYSFHDFDLIHAMKAERILKDGLLITVEVCNIGFSLNLSPQMTEQFPGIVRSVKEIIDDYKSSIISLP